MRVVRSTTGVDSEVLIVLTVTKQESFLFHQGRRGGRGRGRGGAGGRSGLSMAS
jgi:hypothetical protein